MEEFGLEPSDVEFAITNDPIQDEGIITLWVSSISDPCNDDIRDIKHPDFDKYWGNSCECVFTANDQEFIKWLKYNVVPFKTIQEAKGWCLSIGMVYNEELAHSVGG